ncbi:hypothetical protein F5B19DRAFT_479754 [Rostrohypoxylon terebratum]|nr:hypothetical protein F5B19DRAFT_479754 [Rostrohypoxylon terebratum]
MCNYFTITVYNCGHEEPVGEERQSTFCLFRMQKVCTQELGRFRIFEEYVNNWCPNCMPIAEQMRKARDKDGNFKTPVATAIERQLQVAARNAVVQNQFTPPEAPNQVRLKQLNQMADKLLRNQINRPESYATSTVVWILRYIAALPPWMDRQALTREVQPWFAGLLDEDAQATVRPTLRAMKCEGYLDNVMVWSSH